jgi:hypothetical protein
MTRHELYRTPFVFIVVLRALRVPRFVTKKDHNEHKESTKNTKELKKFIRANSQLVF